MTLDKEKGQIGNQVTSQGGGFDPDTAKKFVAVTRDYKEPVTEQPKVENDTPEERLATRERLYSEILYMSGEAKKAGITFSEYVRINGWKETPDSTEIPGAKKIQSITRGNIMKLFGKELNPIIIKATLILLFISTLFPPKIGRGGYGRIWEFLFDESSRKIDILTLLVEYVLILFLMVIVHLFMKDKEKNKSQ